MEKLKRFAKFTCHPGIPGFPASKEWQCFQSNVLEKFSDDVPALWFSTLRSGYCGADPAREPANCTWRVASVDKVVNKTCHGDVFFSAVEQRGRPCFEACGARNTTSPCWVRCFYETALGPDSGKRLTPSAGMPLQDLLEAWAAPFKSDVCPNLEPELEAVSLVV